MNNSPAEIVQRHLILKGLNKFSPEEIVAINPLSQMVRAVEFSEEGEICIENEMNWEYGLFEAPITILIQLMKLLMDKKAKDDKIRKQIADHEA